jgi:hypothetical protein
MTHNGTRSPNGQQTVNIWANVRKSEEQLNPEGRKMRIQPVTLNQVAFGHFLSQSFHKAVIWCSRQSKAAPLRSMGSILATDS